MFAPVLSEFSENIEGCYRGGEDQEIADHSHVIDMAAVALLDDWLPKACGLFFAECPLAEVPCGMQADWNGQSTCGESGHTKEQ